MKILSLSFLLLFLTVFAGSLDAQVPDDSQFSENQPPAAAKNRPNILRALDLSPEQLQQIKQLNQAKKPLMQAALQRQKLANQMLDEAIYADDSNETAIQARLRELQNAHSEVLKLRTANESAIRRILTPIQLGKFRQLRQQFEQTKVNRPNMRDQNAPSVNTLSKPPTKAPTNAYE